EKLSPLIQSHFCAICSPATFVSKLLSSSSDRPNVTSETVSVSHLIVCSVSERTNSSGIAPTSGSIKTTVTSEMSSIGFGPCVSHSQQVAKDREQDNEHHQ